MIILYDRTGVAPDIIWNDDDETLMCFRVNTEDNQGPRPIEVFTTEYEHIQYIEALITPSVAKTWIESNITDEAQKVLANKVLAVATGNRSYTGTTSMKNLNQ